uniref:Uncharacterized protein n=1 Tax=uncultured Thiotrichaceae bacterium TaxID=298394 RepID=A0A6S6UD01_9GAMM|nr:MAG: Unknown protein [uncultured Thiotrichaceae bacterium]
MKHALSLLQRLAISFFLSLALISNLQSAPIPDWAIKATVANASPYVGIDDTELDAIVAERKAQNVSVLELDPGFSEYLNDTEFAATVDVVRRITEKAHAQGMKTVVYITSLEVNTTDGETLPNTMYKDHPDWIQQGFDGTPAVFYGAQEDWVEEGMESAWLSPNSGYRDYFYDRLKLIAASGTDGIWIDVPVYYEIDYNNWGGNEPVAAAAFKQWSIDNGFSVAGYDTPTGISWGDPAFKAWIKWRHENLALFTEGARIAIKSINPEILLIDEVYPVDNMDTTTTGLDQTYRVSSDGHLAVWEIDSVSNALGMKWANKEDFATKITMYKWTRAIDRENPSWAFTYTNEELDAGLVVGAAAIAGVVPFESKTPDMETTVGSQFRTRWFGFIQDNAEALLDTERESQIAVWYSSPSRDFQDYEVGGGYGMFNGYTSPNNDDDWWGGSIYDTPKFKPHFGGYRGASYALSKLHVPYKIIADPGEPAAQLAGIKFLWLPSVAAMSDESITVITQFVQGGGVVFATGTMPGSLDENGSARTNNPLTAMFAQAPGSGVAVYRSDIKGTEFFPSFASISSQADANLSVLDQLVSTYTDDYVTLSAPQEGVHIEVARPSPTKHYLYVLNYSGMQQPLVPNSQTIGLQYKAPNGYQVVSATVKTPDSGGDSGVTTVTDNTDNLYGMNVKVDQFALIEMTLEPTDADDNTGTNPAANITIDGDIADWADLQSFGTDPNDATTENDKLDWQETWMADNAGTDSLYFAYQTRGDIDTSALWAYQTFIDTDENASTGYPIGALGAEFMFEGSTLWKYTGSGGSWAWTVVGSAAVQINGNLAEFRLSRSWLGDDLSKARLLFYGNNAAFGGSTTDVYPDGAFDPTSTQRYFTFEFDSGDGEDGGTGGTDYPSNPVSSITIDGNLSDWSGLESFAADPDDVTGANNKINWIQATFAHSNTDFYVSYQTKEAVDTSAFWGYQMYIDTDESQATGYQVGALGAEYLFEGSTLWQYTGTGTDWSWTQVGAAVVQASGNVAEFQLPRALLGNTEQLRVFLNGNNAAFSGTVADIYPDGALDAASTQRYFTYQLDDNTPTIPSNSVSSLTLDGILDDWTDLDPFAADPDDISGANNKINWLQGWLAHSSSNLYVAYETKDAIDTSGFWGYQVYLDTDSSTTTGFSSGSIGADYLLEGNTLWQYTGTGSDWAWQVVATVNSQFSVNTTELQLSLANLGNPSQLRLFFIGNNAAFSGDSIDAYPDNASTGGYLEYRIN